MSHPQKIENVHLETLNGELCLYDWQRLEVHNLNPTAATVWQLCDGQTSPEQIARQLKGDLTPAQAEELVWLTLARLEKAHLLQAAVVKPAGRKMLTRRELLKGLGVAAVLLPVVSSIVAPGPVEARSPQPVQPVQAIVMYNAGRHQGNLGGRAGADALCVAAAPAGLHAGYTNFRAFISVDGGDEIRDMPGNYGVPTTLPITGPSGSTIANNWADLLDGSLIQSLESASVSPSGVTRWWSGALAPDGSVDVGNICDGGTGGWTPGGLRGITGDTQSTISIWMRAAMQDCVTNPLIICVAY